MLPPSEQLVSSLGRQWYIFKHPGGISTGTGETFQPRREIGLLERLVLAEAGQALDTAVGGTDELPFTLPFPNARTNARATRGRSSRLGLRTLEMR